MWKTDKNQTVLVVKDKESNYI